MKHTLSLLMIFFLFQANSQELEQVWKSPAGSDFEKEFSANWPSLCTSCTTEDFDNDGNSDFTWLSVTRRSIVIVNGKDRDQRYELALGSPLKGNVNHLEVYLINNLPIGTVTAALCNNEVMKGTGTREDSSVVIKNQILTWPKGFILLELEDYNLDGQTDVRFFNSALRRTEVWSL